MSWLPGCGDPNKTVALVVYETRSGRRFDHATDEIRVDHQECVLAECGVIEGRRVLAVEVPALCSYQIDAVNGPVLDIVGPGGSYYKFGQPASRLISAKNMRVIDCDSGNEIGD